ncbi:MAG: hypothetical protein ACK54G_09140, partial [Pseudanabaena sp.]
IITKPLPTDRLNVAKIKKPPTQSFGPPGPGAQQNSQFLVYLCLATYYIIFFLMDDFINGK